MHRRSRDVEHSGNNKSLGMWTLSCGPTLILRAPLRLQNRQQREGESVNNQYKLKGMLCFFIVYFHKAPIITRMFTDAAVVIEICTTYQPIDKKQTSFYLSAECNPLRYVVHTDVHTDVTLQSRAKYWRRPWQLRNRCSHKPPNVLGRWTSQLKSHGLLTDAIHHSGHLSSMVPTLKKKKRSLHRVTRKVCLTLCDHGPGKQKGLQKPVVSKHHYTTQINK